MSALVKSRDKQVQHAVADGPCAYDIPEICDRLKSSRAHVYPYIMSGELQTFKLGRRRLTTPRALADFICRRENIESLENRGERSNIVTDASSSAPNNVSGSQGTATRPATVPMRPMRRPSKDGGKRKPRR
jgi:hypothetical protein